MAKEKTKKPPIPGWGWAFIILCVAIPVITLGGAIPGAIGGAGGFGCAEIARDPKKSTKTKIIFCSLVVGLCWIVFLVFLGGMVYLFQ